MFSIDINYYASNESETECRQNAQTAESLGAVWVWPESRVVSPHFVDIENKGR